jgi:pimeloyl-ACP methyl ester carboxylesterase
MDTDRRTFMTAAGSLAACASLSLLEGCAPSDKASAADLQPLGSGSFDPAAFMTRANADEEFLIAARYWDARLRLEIGERAYRAVIQRGAVAELAQVTAAEPSDITIAGPVEAWIDPRAVISTVIPSVSQLAQGLVIRGDMVSHVAPYQPAIIRLVGLVRAAAGTPSGDTLVKEVERQFDAATAHYVYVRIHGVQYRVYYEETGQGIPLVLQHTAGSDGRQWRHLLEDVEIQKRFRMIAYDLPFHGKSVPPTGVRWWETEYRLTTGLVMDSIVGITKALKLDRPVYMGCSIGGYLAPDLALYHPEHFRAVIGVNASIAGSNAPSRNPSAKADMDLAIGQRANVDTNYHPRINGSWIGTRMYEITSPVASESYRRETGWVYSQGGPGVFAGDLYYYTYDHDLSEGRAGQIDTSKVDVHFLSGEYDPSSIAGPMSMEALAAAIPGSTQAVIKGGSHFAMSDDYPRFREYLMPILDRIAAKHGAGSRSTS